MRLVVGLLSVVALAFAAPASADSPTEMTSVDVFTDVNRCTGTLVTVTIASTVYVHEHGSRVSLHGERTITTSDGFVGRGTDTRVDNGQIFMFRLTDIVTNASGDRFRAHMVLVVDLSTGTLTVDRFELTCLGP
jgi:hypothetical protein